MQESLAWLFRLSHPGRAEKQPRERLLRFGPESLGLSELIGILIRTKTPSVANDKRRRAVANNFPRGATSANRWDLVAAD